MTDEIEVENSENGNKPVTHRLDNLKNRINLDSNSQTNKKYIEVSIKSSFLF